MAQGVVHQGLRLHLENMLMSEAKLKSGIRLSKEERKELLAQLERQSSRAESTERILQRGEQALKSGHLDQARRVLTQLETRAPNLAGLDVFRENLEAAINESKRQANLKTTEEMLTRYIQQRKKPLAELALQTLSDLAPSHPRRSDYEVWVADLDKEVALQQRIDEQLVAGQRALQIDDLARAAQHLEALHKVAPDSQATKQLAAEIAKAEQGQAESAGIERAKQHLEELLANDQLDEAERQMDLLSRMDLPKVTIDFLRQRLEQSRGRLRDTADAAEIEADFEQRLASRDWSSAREVAQQYSQRFPTSSHGAELFNKVNDLEARERRQQSQQEGLATLERFISAKDRNNAELALKLLGRLDLDPARLAQLEARVRGL